MPPKRKQKPTDEPPHYCRECAHVESVTDFHTLTVHGRLPTLGRCPHWTLSRSLLLSQRACKEHFKERI